MFASTPSVLQSFYEPPKSSFAYRIDDFSNHGVWPSVSICILAERQASHRNSNTTDRTSRAQCLNAIYHSLPP